MDYLWSRFYDFTSHVVLTNRKKSMLGGVKNGYYYCYIIINYFHTCTTVFWPWLSVDVIYWCFKSESTLGKALVILHRPAGLFSFYCTPLHLFFALSLSPELCIFCPPWSAHPLQTSGPTLWANQLAMPPRSISRGLVCAWLMLSKSFKNKLCSKSENCKELVWSFSLIFNSER